MQSNLDLLDRVIIHSNKWLKLIEQKFVQNRKVLTYYIVERADCVVIIPMTEKRNLLVLSQFRIPTESFSLEFPMGGVDPNETAEIAAIRELREETGLLVDTVTHIGSYDALPGLTKQKVHIFIAHINDAKLQSCEIVCSSDDEPISDFQITHLDKLEKMIQGKEVLDSCTLVSFLHLMLYLKKNGTI